MLNYSVPNQSSKATSKTKSKTTCKFLFNKKQPKNGLLIRKLSQDQSFA